MSSPKSTDPRHHSSSYGTFPDGDQRSSAYLSRSVSTPGTYSKSHPAVPEKRHAPPLTVGHPAVSEYAHTRVDRSSVLTHSPTHLVAGSPVVGTGDQFVSKGLLKGVSMNFNPPVVSDTQTPMSDPIPNRIELPYGRGPPLHIKAPDWHALVALLSRLCDTIVVPKGYGGIASDNPPTSTLRVVVNFVKVHSLSDERQVVLYLTVDYPVPNGQLYAAYTQNNPSILPFSYTKSPTPEPLRYRADSPVSKWFNIPSLQENPYLTLPITLHDLALYLSRAVELSRRSSVQERSNGFHRLAKAVDRHYLPVHYRSPSWMTKIWRFLGLRKIKTSREENDERSTIVTPFTVDSIL